MVYNMETNEKIDLLNLAKKYAELYNKEKDNFPYRLNVINELHDDENAHSRILIRLLQYKDKDEYTWLKFFVNRMKDYCEGEFDIEILNPEIKTEHNIGYGRIDGFIWEKGKYAIIIENKIWNAPDQKEQIDRYVNYVNQHLEVKDENIYVIYLTLDGSKEVSENSLSNITKNNLGNRFITVNFQDDIIPWLEDDILPNCKVKEKCLGSAVYQYIDYLKDRLGQLDYQRQAQKNALKQILNDMKMAEAENYYKELKKLAIALGNEVNILGNNVAGKFQELTKTCFADFTDFNFDDNNRIKLDGGYYQVYNKQWNGIKDLNPHFEWYPISYSYLFESKKLTFVFHIEGNKREECGKILLQKAEKNKYLERINSTTYYKKEYTLEVPFASMNDDEQREFLKSVYSSEEVKKIIELMNGTIDEMKKIEEK